jgi:hypothetical protein
MHQRRRRFTCSPPPPACTRRTSAGRLFRLTVACFQGLVGARLEEPSAWPAARDRRRLAPACPPAWGAPRPPVCPRLATNCLKGLDGTELSRGCLAMRFPSSSNVTVPDEPHSQRQDWWLAVCFWITKTDISLDLWKFWGMYLLDAQRQLSMCLFLDYS